MSNFAERLKRLRIEKDVTQQELGSVIGVKHYSIYTYEKGRSAPDIDGLIALADYFDVTVDYLIGRSDRR